MSYEVHVGSNDAREHLVSTFATAITCGNDCSANFSANLCANMERNDADSVACDSIQADSSSSAYVVVDTRFDEADQPDQADQADQAEAVPMMYILIGAGAIGGLVVIVITVVVARRTCCTPTGRSKGMQLPKEEQTLTENGISVAIRTQQVEMIENPGPTRGAPHRGRPQRGKRPHRGKPHRGKPHGRL